MSVLATAHAFNAPPVGVKCVPFVNDGDTVLPPIELYEHCRHAMESGLPVLQQAGAPRSQPVVIVGSSPGLVEQLPEVARLVQDGAALMSVKGAHDYLLDRFLVSDYAVAGDPQESRADVFRKPRMGTLYCMASQCHPAAWEKLRGYQVLIWHPVIGPEQAILPEWKGVRRVYGGNTTGLRAISLAWILGFRRVILAGFESCLHSEGLMRMTGDRFLDIDPPFKVCWAGNWYWQTKSLHKQCEDLMPTLRQCPGIKVDALGEGALPHILRTGKRAGWPV